MVEDGSESVIVSLSEDEALVLYEFLTRFDTRGDLRVEDQAEERVLWDLLCLLEQQLVPPLRHDYAALLATARARVRDPEEPGPG